MPSDDLRSYAMSDTDFYSLVNIKLDNSQKAIDRAWRRTALKYNPYKWQGMRDRLRGRRKKNRNDLIAKEERLRQGKDENEESDYQKIAEDGKRRRKEKEYALRRDKQHEAEQNRYEEKHPEQTTPELPTNQSSISAVDRTVITRWPQEEQPGETFSVGQVHIKGPVSPLWRNRSAALNIWKNPWFAIVMDIRLMLAQNSRAPHVLYFRISPIVSGPALLALASSSTRSPALSVSAPCCRRNSSFMDF
ncbi:hypothetical protein MMC29_001171 [Sticta canariensis]|nr:hypothetical protein [Sticta canariensis]